MAASASIDSGSGGRVVFSFDRGLTRNIAVFLAVLLLVFSAYLIFAGNGGETSRTPIFLRDVSGFSAGEKEALLEVAYAAVDDFYAGRRRSDFDPSFGGVGNEVYVVFRLDGRRWGAGRASCGNLAESVYNAAYRILDEKSCDGTLTCYGGRSLKDADFQAEVFILDRGFEVSDVNIFRVKKSGMHGLEYEPGVHAIRIIHGAGNATYLDDVLIQGDVEPERMVERLCGSLGLDGFCANTPGVVVRLHRSTHFMKLERDGRVLDVFRGNIVTDELPRLRDVNESFNAMSGWISANLNDEGFFNYLYFLGSGSYSTSNNMIRQLMASRFLAELAGEDEAYLDLHRRNLEYVFENWYLRDGDFGYIYFSDKSKLGATAMALRTLAYSPLLDEYGVEAGCLANTLIGLQNEDGSFKAWMIEPDYAYDEDYLLTFYSGEAILALTEYYGRTGDERFLDAALKSQNYYLVEYVDRLGENYYPAYVPWHTMSLYRLYQITGNESYVDAVFILNDELLKIQQTEKPEFIDVWGRFFNPRYPQYGYPHSSSTGVYLEGVTYAYELARERNDTARMKTYGESVRLASLNIINLQFDSENTYYLNRPERVLGAIRVGVAQNSIRVDTTQHSADAFKRILTVFTEEEFSAQTPG